MCFLLKPIVSPKKLFPLFLIFFPGKSGKEQGEVEVFLCLGFSIFFVRELKDREAQDGLCPGGLLAAFSPRMGFEVITDETYRYSKEDISVLGVGNVQEEWVRFGRTS